MERLRLILERRQSGGVVPRGINISPGRIAGTRSGGSGALFIGSLSLSLWPKREFCMGGCVRARGFLRMSFGIVPVIEDF